MTRIRSIPGAAALVAGVVFGVSAAASGAGPAAGPADKPPVPSGTMAARALLAGRWRLDPERSDDARAKMRDARGDREPPRGRPAGGSGGRGGGRGGPGRDGFGPGGGGDPRESLRALMEPAVELLITPTEREIVILEKDGRLRTLHPDGRSYKAEGGRAEVKTRWEGAELVVETRLEDGPRTTETFVVSSIIAASSPAGAEADAPAEPRRLTVTLALEGRRGRPITLNRVYAPEGAPAE